MKTLENIQDLKKLLLNPYTIIDLKKHLKSFIQDKDQAEEMITQYTCYYNAIKRWESNHKETEILHQLEISNLLEQQ